MSGILYPILILTLFLIVQILTMMASRKAVLGKNKQQLLDSVNTSNKVYTNEELSILISEQQEALRGMNTFTEELSNKINEKKDETYKSPGSLRIYDKVYGNFFSDQKNYIVFQLGNMKFSNSFMLSISIGVYQYGYCNKILASTYTYGTDDIFYSPTASYLQKTNKLPVYYARDKNKQLYLIVGINKMNYVGVWFEQVSTMWGIHDEVFKSGWNVYSTDDISNMELVTLCGEQ